MSGRKAPSVVASRALLPAVTLMAVLAAPAAAQLARPVAPAPDAPKVIVATFARDQADSLLAVTLADGLRDRLRLVATSSFNIIAKNIMNENLEASGFPRDVPQETNIWRQLARFLNVRILIEGNILRRPGDSVLVIARLQELTGAAPQSASASAVVPLARANGTTGAELANRLRDAYRSFEHVQTCNRWVDSTNYVRAREAADRAIRQFPNSATAHLCVVRILRAQNAPFDTILAAAMRAQTADSLNSNILREVARLLESRNDTARLIPQLRKILAVDVRDNDLRISVARMLIARNASDSVAARADADSAVALIDEGLANNPSQVELLRARAIGLGAGRRFADAAATLAQVAEVDSANIDSLFGVRMTNYLQLVPDSARLLEWTRIFTARLPTQPGYWYTLASILISRGDSAGAMEATRGLLSRVAGDSAPMNRGLRARGSILLANLLWPRGEADSALAYADGAMAADSALRQNAGGVYLQAGLRSFRDSVWTTAVQRLQRGKELLNGSRAVVPAAFFLALSQYRLGVAADSSAQGSRNCDDVRRAQQLWDQVEQNIIAGVAQNRDLANQFLTQVIPAYKQRAEQFARNFRCG